MANERARLLRELQEESRRSAAGGVFLLQAVAERSGLNLTDLQCINILTSTGPITAGRLAEMMGLTTGAITGLINRMEQAGYVRREKDPGDGRRVVIQPILGELERAGAGFFGSQQRGLDALFAGYDDRDLAVILDFTRKTNVMTEEEIATIRAAAAGDAGDALAAPLGSVARGRLVFANGAGQLTLRAGTRTNDLYRARFEGATPKIRAEDGVVTFRFPKRFGLFNWRDQSGEVLLNPAISWAIEVRGGAFALEADLRGLPLTSFVATWGSKDLNLTLPEPAGLVPIQLSGGASDVNIRRPSGVEARLSVKGGVSTLTFDGQRFEFMAGKFQLQSPGYNGASDRFDIEVTGGTHALTVQ
jgi:DNA-binding MarR family transcriptional regulator